jgi:hypothetical protein
MKSTSSGTVKISEPKQWQVSRAQTKQLGEQNVEKGDRTVHSNHVIRRMEGRSKNQYSQDLSTIWTNRNETDGLVLSRRPPRLLIQDIDEHP